MIANPRDGVRVGIDAVNGLRTDLRTLHLLLSFRCRHAGPVSFSCPSCMMYICLNISYNKAHAYSR